MSFLFRWLVTSLCIMALPSLIPGISVDDLQSALAAGALLGILNGIVRPILVFFTLPLTVVSLGLFLLVINAVMLQIVSHVVSGFHTANFTAAFLGALIVSVVSWVAHWKSPSAKTVWFRGGSRSGATRGRDGLIELREGADGNWS